MIYLASPYSDESKRVEAARYRAARRCAAAMMGRGMHVYSPIVNSHEIARVGKLPGDWSFWELYDEWFIQRCESMCVLAINGWQESRGVTAEIKGFEKQGKAICLVDERGELLPGGQWVGGRPGGLI